MTEQTRKSRALRQMKDLALESTDPVYLAHRVKVLGKKGAQKIAEKRQRKV